MQMEEYVPDSMPTKSTSARSFSSPAPRNPAPTNRMDATGSSAISEVLIERTSVWLSAWFAAWL